MKSRTVKGLIDACWLLMFAVILVIVLFGAGWLAMVFGPVSGLAVSGCFLAISGYFAATYKPSFYVGPLAIFLVIAVNGFVFLVCAGVLVGAWKLE